MLLSPFLIHFAYCGKLAKYKMRSLKTSLRIEFIKPFIVVLAVLLYDLIGSFESDAEHKKNDYHGAKRLQRICNRLSLFRVYF